MVTLPAPSSLEEAAQRSSQSVTVNELNSMMGMYEPFSLAKLSKKGAEMHELAARGSSSRLSPRREASSGDGHGRRSTSHFREIPADTIAEQEDVCSSSSDEESKQ